MNYVAALARIAVLEAQRDELAERVAELEAERQGATVLVQRVQASADHLHEAARLALEELARTFGPA